MAEAEQTSSWGALTGVAIALATLVLIAAIILPSYLSRRAEERNAAAFAAAAQPVLDSLIEAESGQKTKNGKFWRDKTDDLTPEATKQALGVDVSTAANVTFAVFPPDLEADPTLRIEARGKGDWAGRSLLCVYDSIEHSKNCKHGK